MGKYPDESHKTGVWRVMPAREFGEWLDAQTVPSSIRYIVDHHTWSPATAASTPNGFLSQVLDIFRGYYEKPESRGGRGWKRDHGPQLWLADIDGQPWVVIAANLWVQGPHCAYFNGCSVGIETVWNGDKTAWNEVILRGLYYIHKAFEKKAGIPLKRGVTGPTNTNVPSANGKGWLFHRDAKDSNKTCPGTKNTHALLQSAFDRYERGELDMADIRHVSSATVKPELKKLVDAGIITREDLYDEADELDDVAGIDFVLTVAGRIVGILQEKGIVPKR